MRQRLTSGQLVRIRWIRSRHQAVQGDPSRPQGPRDVAQNREQVQEVDIGSRKNELVAWQEKLFGMDSVVPHMAGLDTWTI